MRNRIITYRYIVMILITSIAFLSCSKKEPPFQEIDLIAEITTVDKQINPKGKCITDRLKIRVEPYLDSEQIGSLLENDIVEIISKTEWKDSIDGLNGNWLEIIKDDIQGWVYGGYISFKEEEINTNVDYKRKEIIDEIEIEGIGEIKKIISEQIIHNAGEKGNWSSLSYSEDKSVFEIYIPKKWRFNDYSVFYDENEMKIAELYPGFLNIDIGERFNLDPDSYFKDWEGPIPEIITIEDYNGNPNYNGQLYISSGFAFGGESGHIKWYPISFYFYNENLCFGMKFYSRNENYESDLQIFKLIANTIKFPIE